MVRAEIDLVAKTELAAGRQAQGRPAAGPAPDRGGRRPERAHDLSRLPDDGGPAHHRHSRDLERAARSRAETLRKTPGRAGHRSARAESAAAARQVLFDIIERESAQIKLKAAAHRRRSKVVDALAADRLLFDDSPEGERLRRFELACGRGIWRSLDSLRKIRQATKDPLSVVHCPLPVADATTEALDEPESTNEPTDSPLSVVRCPLQAASCAADAVVETGTTNEPTELAENMTNEPTGEGRRNEDGGRRNEDGGRNEAPNEPIELAENVTNEPTRERQRNEEGNATNEPKLAVASMFGDGLPTAPECLMFGEGLPIPPER